MNNIKNIKIKQIIPYVLIIIGFIAIAFAYTPYVLDGKIVNQSDISSWRGMANEIIEYNESHPGDKALWTNSMFSGMPATSISMTYDGNILDYIYKILFIGERPVSYLIISLVSGFLLFLAFGVNVYLSAIGAIAITFCSYNMQIIQVGHNSKMVAIAFMPMVLAAIVYAYRKNSLWGALLFAFALSFQIKANHPQITYYLAIIVFGFVLAEFISSLKTKSFHRFIKTSLIVLVGGLLGIATNANHLIPTYEYSKYTMRGGSELSFDKEKQSGSGLKIDYATAWSYGIEETPNLMIPNFNGGASSGSLDRSSETYKVLSSKYQGAESIIKQLPLYWGPQPFTAGPMYMGAICIFLFFLGLFLIDGKYKWWIAGVSLLALLLAWGSHFLWFSELFFKYAPLYNKFRTVSMILVILQITIPVMGFLSLNTILGGGVDRKKFKNSMIAALSITAGISFIFALFPSLVGNFISASDGSLPKDIANALIDDRKSLLRGDAIRSILFIIISASIIILCYKKLLKNNVAIASLALLIIIDFWGVDKRYLNKSHFFPKRNFMAQFEKRPVDKIILSDNDKYYRVLDLSVNTFNDSHVSYHHKTIGGYSPVKLQRYQDLIDYYISPEIGRLTTDINKSLPTAKTIADIQDSISFYPILSMLNTKYIVFDPNNPPLENNNRLGNAWFVSNIVTAESADEEIAKLGIIDPSKEAVLYKPLLPSDIRNTFSTNGTISLTSYSPNTLKYSYTSDNDGIAVFSEIYYPIGWIATIDGKESKILRANYALRALMLPAGSHNIVFTYSPSSIKAGKYISLAGSSSLIILLIILLGITIRKR